jgi:excisionase family DNA binding protein
MTHLPQELATAREIARRYGVTVETVNRWTREGRIPCVRPSRRTVRYALADVEAAVSRARKGTPRV